MMQKGWVPSGARHPCLFGSPEPCTQVWKCSGRKIGDDFSSWKVFDLKNHLLLRTRRLWQKLQTHFFHRLYSKFWIQKGISPKKKKRKIGLKEKYELVSHGVVSVFFLHLFWTRKWIKKKKELERIPWWSSAKDSACSLPGFNPWAGSRDSTSCVSSRVNQNT